MQKGLLIGTVVAPFMLTMILVFAWPWLGLLTIVPAVFWAAVFAFVGAARSDPDWSVVLSAFFPLTTCLAAFCLARLLRQSILG